MEKRTPTSAPHTLAEPAEEDELWLAPHEISWLTVPYSVQAVRTPTTYSLEPQNVYPASTIVDTSKLLANAPEIYSYPPPSQDFAHTQPQEPLTNAQQHVWANGVSHDANPSQFGIPAPEVDTTYEYSDNAHYIHSYPFTPIASSMAPHTFVDPTVWAPMNAVNASYPSVPNTMSRGSEIALLDPQSISCIPIQTSPPNHAVPTPISTPGSSRTSIPSARPISHTPPVLILSPSRTVIPTPGPIRKSKGKAAGKSVRKGPLDSSARRKAEDMRDIGACWRCKKYKKSCNGPGICDQCLVPGFKVWPSQLGCRRERLESVVLFLLPACMEEHFQLTPPDRSKGGTWRVLKFSPHPTTLKLPKGEQDSKWALSQVEARSISLFNEDYAELAMIAERYQKSLPTPNKCLEASCDLLLATCTWFKCFIATPGEPKEIPVSQLPQTAAQVRNTFRRLTILLQTLALSTKRADWFPAFLSALIAAVSAVIFIDGANMIPSPVRELIYGNFAETASSMRYHGYDLLVDILRASTSGLNPLELKCWKENGGGKEMEKKADAKERQILLGMQPPALNGMRELKAWQERYQATLDEGKNMFAMEMYEVARVRPIASLFKIFAL